MVLKKLPDFIEQAKKIKGEAAYEVLARVQELEREGKKIIHLEIGQPDFITPKVICDEAIKAIKKGKTKYTSPLGVFELRSAIADYLNKKRGLKVSPRMIGVTPSAKTAIYLAMIAILKPGDEVIYPDPGFPAYGNLVEFLGCRAKPVPLIEENNFNFDLKIFSNLFSSKTKLVILNSPNNPTGSVIPRKNLEFIANLIKKHNCWVLSDEIYSELFYDIKNYPSIFSLKNMPERTLLIDGFSKTYSMTGWRLGYLIFPEKFESIIDNLFVNSFACVADFIQYAGIVALKKANKDVKKMTEEFKKRRDFIVKGLNEIKGISCLKPPGAFYVFPNIKSFGLSSQKLADYLLDKAGVALLPGTAFGKYGEGYLRISYANSIGNIAKALRKIEKALKNIT
ncbi:pyridoxal phosphate-dependent aminotransferase [Candidatus Wolfebacteria bacterium]|nr:pyridoxal phosphate-dependent aminotransferase [Candidatus Wolfebacteria bacterium]